MSLTRCFFIAALLIATSTLGCSAIRVGEKAKQPQAVERLLGSSIEAVRAELGQPDRSDPRFDSFFPAGVIVDYDSMKRVTKVSATHLISGDSYRGKVLGVALGDSVKDCVAAWGDAVDAEATSYEYERVTWHHKEYVLELEVWARDGDGSDKAFGYYKEGTVKRIAVSRKP